TARTVRLIAEGAVWAAGGPGGRQGGAGKEADGSAGSDVLATAVGTAGAGFGAAAGAGASGAGVIGGCACVVVTIGAGEPDGATVEQPATTSNPASSAATRPATLAGERAGMRAKRRTCTKGVP